MDKKQSGRPNGPARYRLKEKAFFGDVRVQRGNDFLPYSDVLLDPEEQPLLNPISGPYDGKGGERRPLIVEFDGIPGHHLEPMNEAGKWMRRNWRALKVEAEKERVADVDDDFPINPIDALTIIGPGALVLKPVGENV